MPPSKNSNIPSSLTSKFQLVSSKSKQKSNSKNNNNEPNNNNSSGEKKRIKACLRCRKSKVKCENTGDGSCKRCTNNGWDCVYQMKIQSYSSKEVKLVSETISTNTSEEKGNLDKKDGELRAYPRIPQQQPQQPPISHNVHYLPHPPPLGIIPPQDSWKNSVENKLENFNDTLNEIMGFIKDGKFNNKLPNPQLVNSDANNSHPLDNYPYQRTILPALSSFPSFSSRPPVYHLETPNNRLLSDYHDSNLRHPSSAMNIDPNEYRYDFNYNNNNNNNNYNNKFGCSHESDKNDSKSKNGKKRRVEEEESIPLTSSSSSSSLNNDLFQPKKKMRHQESDSDSNDNLKLLFSKALSKNANKSIQKYFAFDRFDELYDYFIEFVGPHLFGFDLSKFDRKSIYIKSNLMVTLICLLGMMNEKDCNKTELMDILKEMYLENVNEIIFRNKDKKTSTSSWGIDFDEELESNEGIKLSNNKESSNKETSSNREKASSIFQTKEEYDKYMDLCGKSNKSKSWRKWNLLTKSEKSQEIELSKEFKLFMNIAALCIGTLWFEDSQLLLGVALQLAAELKLNHSFISLSNGDKITTIDKKNPEVIMEEDFEKSIYITEINKLKLWYLIYIIDTQQSFLSNRQSLMNSDNDFSLKNSRKLLFPYNNNKQQKNLLINDIELVVSFDSSHHDKTLNEKLLNNSSAYNDLKLVSQLEFNQAIHAVLMGEGWQLMNPESIGIPWKTNLQLDQWMAHWTCLLTPIHQIGNTWSIKSTLIYYNFARLHINHTNELKEINLIQNVDKSDETDVDSEEFTNGSYELGSKDIALTSAQDLINSIITDKDIIDNLRYSPLHIYVMSYYSGLTLLDSTDYEEFLKSINSREKNQELIQNFQLKTQEYLETLSLVQSLIKTLKQNLPMDRNFGLKIIRALKKKLENKYSIFKKNWWKYYTLINDNNSESSKIRLLEDLDDEEIDKFIGEIKNNNGLNDENTSHNGGQILAWPGINHYHP